MGDGAAKKSLTDFARRLLAEWRRLGLARDGAARMVVAVSGGADSTALLAALGELKGAGRLRPELTVTHLDHGLRGEAGRADARFVAGLAAQFGYEFEAGRADVPARVRETGDNLEQAARRARYEFLGRAARARAACVVLTAHTLDDQAETVLLALLRGSGANGLGGMARTRALDSARPAVTLVRPLLAWARRAETESYCRARGVAWRADAMNEDERFARVRLRRQVLPLLETFNPRAAHALARTAELLRADSAALDTQAARLLNEAMDDAAVAATNKIVNDESAPPSADDELTRLSADDGSARPSADDGSARPSDACGVAPPLRVEVLAGAPEAVRRRALRMWLARGRGDLRRLEAVHVAAVERLLGGERGGRVAELPGGASVERRGRRLSFRPAEPKTGGE